MRGCALLALVSCLHLVACTVGNVPRPEAVCPSWAADVFQDDWIHLARLASNSPSLSAKYKELGRQRSDLHRALGAKVGREKLRAARSDPVSWIVDAIKQYRSGDRCPLELELVLTAAFSDSIPKLELIRLDVLGIKPLGRLLIRSWDSFSDKNELSNAVVMSGARYVSDEIADVLRAKRHNHAETVVLLRLAGLLGDPAIAETLKIFLNCDVVMLRAAAAEAFGSIGTPELMSYLLGSYPREPDVQVRGQILLSLGRARYSPARERILKAIQAREVPIRVAAIGALHWVLDGSSPREFQAVFQDADELTSVILLSDIGHPGFPWTADLLIDLATRWTGPVRSEALRGLAYIGEREDWNRARHLAESDLDQFLGDIRFSGDDWLRDRHDPLIPEFLRRHLRDIVNLRAKLPSLGRLVDVAKRGALEPGEHQWACQLFCYLEGSLRLPDLLRQFTGWEDMLQVVRLLSIVRSKESVSLDGTVVLVQPLTRVEEVDALLSAKGFQVHALGGLWGTIPPGKWDLHELLLHCGPPRCGPERTAVCVVNYGRKVAVCALQSVKCTLTAWIEDSRPRR